MYEKFETEQFYYTSKQRYFDDKYHVKKCIIVSYLFIPEIKKVIRFENHFGELLTSLEYMEELEEDEYENFTKPDEFEECFKREDLTGELQKYCPDPEKQKAYFYKRAFYRHEPLSILLTLYDDFVGFRYCRQKSYFGIETSSLNKQNLKHYSQIVRNLIMSFIQEGKIKVNSLNEYINLIGLMGNFIEVIEREGASDESLTLLRMIDEKIKDNEPFLSNFYSEFLNSVLDAMHPKVFERCGHCEQFIIKVTSSKKYCSAKVEGEDCAKKARNQRTYERRKKAPTEK